MGKDFFVIIDILMYKLFVEIKCKFVDIRLFFFNCIIFFCINFLVRIDCKVLF